MAATESSSLEEFAAHGESAMYSTIVSGVYGGAVAYGMSRTQSPSECFVAGTLVKTADGDRPIEEIVIPMTTCSMRCRFCRTTESPHPMKCWRQRCPGAARFSSESVSKRRPKLNSTTYERPSPQRTRP
jgi:hypothetical protein